MADDDARTGDNTDDKPADTGKPDPQPDTARTDDTDWKAEARKWEKRAKENADSAKRLADIEDAKKTEQQKLTEQLEAAKAEGAKASISALRMEVALDKAPEGMSLQQVRKLAKRLDGSTRDELEADADELFADYPVGGEDSKGPPSKRPKERLRGGGQPDEEPEPDVAKILDRIPRI